MFKSFSVFRSRTGLNRCLALRPSPCLRLAEENITCTHCSKPPILLELVLRLARQETRRKPPFKQLG